MNVAKRFSAVSASPALEHRLDDRHHWWQWLNTLGADASAVAISWQLLLAQSLRVRLHHVDIAVLGLLSWVVYGADYVLDGYRGVAPISIPARHQFFRKHARAATAALFACASTCLALGVFLLQGDVFRLGVITFAGVVAYFFLVHFPSYDLRSRWPREFVVGVLFAVGTSFFVWADGKQERWHLLAPFVVLACLCCLNCAASEYWQWRQQTNSRPAPSAGAVWVGHHLRSLAIAFSVGVLVLCLGGWLPVTIGCAAIFSSGCLCVLSTRYVTLGQNRSRALADLVLCSPCMFLIVGAFR